jgi:HEPN domain-containing protein
LKIGYFEATFLSQQLLDLSNKILLADVTGNHHIHSILLVLTSSFAERVYSLAMEGKAI